MEKQYFETLIEEVPYLEVSLEWCHNDGRGKFDEEFKSGIYTVNASFECHETGTVEDYDPDVQPSFISDGLSVYDLEVNVYDPEGNEIQLSPDQKDELEKEIKQSIKSV